MAKKQASPVSEEEIRSLIHQMIRRMIFCALLLIVVGFAILGGVTLWKG
ncbi:MAG: hypothetical protein Q4C74_03300 [Rothia sp. (in: high G+C Gram-positive bacteria)]|nr:hypothetical protein [Rothia sp. (in: high G+C Gram-positive bacteria)]